MYLKVYWSIKTPLRRPSMGVARSGLWAPVRIELRSSNDFPYSLCVVTFFSTDKTFGNLKMSLSGFTFQHQKTRQISIDEDVCWRLSGVST